MLSSLHLPPPFSSSSHSRPLYLKFRTTHLENLRYLRALGVVPKNARDAPPPDAVVHILSTVNYVRSKGVAASDFPRIAFHCPELFSPSFETAQMEDVFGFLSEDLRASAEESRGFVVNCPKLLLSNREYCLSPTLEYLRELGLDKLNVPSKINAHLLNTRVRKLHERVTFLRSVGLDDEEAAEVCARMRAILGYDVEGNLRPKYDFLVEEMERGLDELKEFPQYFGFSLGRRIRPRHWHLKRRNVRIKLNRMLLWSDKKFFSKWK